jgi:hypothetical protein
MQKRSRRLLSSLLASIVLLVAVLALVPIPAAVCGESAVYRIAFGLYTCEHNAESAANFSCFERIGGWREYLSVRALSREQCGLREPRPFVPWIYRLGILE